jgi:4-amino-4-deoxy-L-arabinose transferase-like glycosyltransferase
MHRNARAVCWAVLGIMAMSLGLECWALTRDLPYPDVDEPTFVRAAVHISSTGDLDPHWFGHPGSTTIYPLAGLYHAWDVVAHGGPAFGVNAELAAKFQSSPSAYYVIGRLWSIAFTVAAIPLVFLVGRRCFSTTVGLAGAALWAIVPSAVSYGRIVRTDSAGVFFALVALLMIVRIVDRPTVRDHILAGAAIGVGISSRYFLAVFVPVLVLAGVIALRRDIPKAFLAVFAGVGATIVTFALTTPYFFLNWTTARSSLSAENAAHVGHDGLSPIGNLRWYLGTSIPNTLSWPVALAAVAGVAFALRRPRDVHRLLLIAASATFLAAISASKLHWERWPLPTLPVVVLLAAQGLVELVAVVTKRTATPVPKSAVAAALGLVALVPTVKVIQTNVRESKPSTRVIAGRWIEDHIPDGSLLVNEVQTAPLHDQDLHVLSRYSLPHGGRTIDWYVRHGYRYFVVNVGVSSVYLSHPRRYPEAAALYHKLRRKSCLVHTFPAGSGQYGPFIRIYGFMPTGAGCPAPSTLDGQDGKRW